MNHFAHKEIICGVWQWSSAFITENCGDPDRFTSCRRYLITSPAQLGRCTWQPGDHLYSRIGIWITRTQWRTPTRDPTSGHPHCGFQATALPFSDSASTGTDLFQFSTQLMPVFASPITSKQLGRDHLINRQSHFRPLSSLYLSGRTTLISFCHLSKNIYSLA